MNEAEGPNADQRTFWAEAGEVWVERQGALDALFAEVQARLLTLADPQPGERVLDVGCGAGAGVLAAAGRAAPTGRVLGVDVSPPLVDLARRRLAGVAGAAVRLADAQTEAFEPGDLDLVLSRFGVMFFADPVAAFANLRAALAPGGRIAFVAWGPRAENPWFEVPRRAAEARLGALPVAPPGAPGPFAFADPARPAAILGAAGFADVQVSVERAALHPPGGPAEAADLACALGPARAALRERGGSEADASAIRDAVAGAFAEHASGGAVAAPAALHLARATRP